MRKLLFPGLVGLLFVILAACGSSATAVPEAKQAPAAPAAAAQPAAPAAAAQPAAPAVPAAKAAPVAASLAQVAAELAGKPGAIYVGDLKQLVGPATKPELGLGPNGNIPLNLLQGSEWIFKSDYYNTLLKKAKLDNPTQLVTSGKKFNLQYACINRALQPCISKANFLIPNLLKRTEGQLEIKVVSYPELGIAGPDTIALVRDGTLGFAEITGAYVGGDLPVLDMYYFWGLFSDRETDFKAVTAVLKELDGYIERATDSGVVATHNWYAGNDQWFFSRKRLDKPEDYKGLKTRSHGTTLTDLINGLGGEAQFVAFAETYTALERGILGAAMSGGNAGYGQRWYEVADYIVGPAISMPADLLIFNKKVWDSFPQDIQQIILEEGAKEELEQLRMAPVWNATGLQVNLDKGMKLIQWDQNTYDFILNEVVLKKMIPGWVKRVGGSGSAEVKLFNEKFGPLAGVKVNPDGSASLLSSKKVAAAAVAAPAQLAAYATKYDGGPGAIYLGDINQLVGPALTKDQGGLDGEVPLDALKRHEYVYQSPYYQDLLAKANLTNPTKLVTTGKNITIQHACINRALLTCKIIETYFAPNLEKRTNGQVKLVISSFPELGLAGPDTLALVNDGTLAMADIYGGYVAGDLPAIEVLYMWGMFPDNKTHYDVTAALNADVEKLVKDATGGSIVINHNWYAGVSQYFFCNKKITTLDDFKGLKTRSHGTALSEWINGMGATAQFVAFSETYTALERGILDCGVTGADPGYGQRWYEVTKYLNGPLVTFTSTNNVVNKDVWNKLTRDLQQIMLEEGAKTELEALRLAAIQNEVGTLRNINAGMELVEFSKELKDHSYNVALLKGVLPSWVKRVGGPDKPIVKIFNEKVTPIVGLRVEPDGSITAVPKAR